MTRPNRDLEVAGWSLQQVVAVHLTNFNDADGTNGVWMDEFRFYGTNGAAPVAPYDFNGFAPSQISGDLER